MFKKIILTIIIAFIIIPCAFAEEEDFSQMNPTVKITSYKKLYTDNIIAFGSGSGTVINSNGLVLTNHHVIFNESELKPLDAFEVCITFDVQKKPVCKYTAQLIANDKTLDIALLKINSKDVFGQPIGDLQYLDYQTNATPQEGSTVQIIGYPGSGGETVTITKGQISGFDKYNGYTYFKTDTDFDHGSSGGTALDETGNFIGMPTYIRTYAENVGYFLDLREALSWIDKHINKAVNKNTSAERLLKEKMALIFQANKNLKYNSVNYPHFSIALPKGWRFIEINNNGFFAEQEGMTDGVSFNLFASYYQFSIDEGYIKKLDEELNRIKKIYPDYKKEEVTVSGAKGWKVTYTSFNQRNFAYYIPYGYALVSFNYSIDLDEEEKQQKAIKPVLDAFKFTKKQNKPQIPLALTFEEPSFKITMFDDWLMQKPVSNQPIDLLAEAVQKENYEGYIHIYYRQIPKDERHLSSKERLDETTKYLGQSKLIYKNAEVILDGLEGWLHTLEYEGSQYQEMRKNLTIKLRNGEYEFVILYDDLSKNFDSNLPGIRKILKSFQFTNDDLPKKGQYHFGSLDHLFKDIQYHRFAAAIGNLADKEIIKGYKNGTFRPERKISRAEALKIILESKNHLEKEKGRGKTVNFDDYQKPIARMRDVKLNHWFNRYASYALKQKYINGYPDKTFRPLQSISLAETLKIIMNVYEIPVWQGDTTDWHKPYMDKGYELGLLPRDFDNPAHLLTRAELVYLVDRVYKEAK